MSNVNFCKQAWLFTCKVYVNQIMVLNVYSNCKPMIITKKKKKKKKIHTP